jgi:hypothetical protein
VHGRQAEFIEQLGDGDGQVVRGAAGALGLARRVAVAGQVDGDHVTLGGQLVGDRVPAPPGEALAVQQHQRLTAPGAVVGQPGPGRRRLPRLATRRDVGVGG